MVSGFGLIIQRERRQNWNIFWRLSYFHRIAGFPIGIRDKAVMLIAGCDAAAIIVTAEISLVRFHIFV